MKYRNIYAPVFTLSIGNKLIATFVHAQIGDFWYLTITNELTQVWKTYQFKSQSTCFGMITKTVNRFNKIYMP